MSSGRSALKSAAHYSALFPLHSPRAGTCRTSLADSSNHRPEGFGFVKQSGGHVKLCSEPGEGTTVKLYLPRIAAAASELAEEPQPLLAKTSGERILVVEDDEDVRSFIADRM
jgi:hypothetical protein